jgi:cytochrome c peroxidase
VALLLGGGLLGAAAAGPATVPVPACASAPDADIACLRAAYARPRAQWPAPQVDRGVAWQELAPLPDAAPAPADNPTTPAKVALGRRLFEDPRLSRSGQIACASCHDRELGWGDGRSVAIGHDRQHGRRNSLSVAMSGLLQPLFWDGRADTLEQQAMHPIEDPREMASRADLAVHRVAARADYRRAFAAAFGDDRIDTRTIARALAAYQRSLLPRPNRYDRFLAGTSAALDDQQLRGLHLFRTRARCMNCHSGATLSDGGFHNLGLHHYGGRRQDLGRYEVSGDPADAGRFRTPSLRMLASTGPYMHNGQIRDLRKLVLLYASGMPRPRPPAPLPAGAAPFPQPDPLLQPLGLSADEVDALTAFLRAL